MVDHELVKVGVGQESIRLSKSSLRHEQGILRFTNTAILRPPRDVHKPFSISPVDDLHTYKSATSSSSTPVFHALFKIRLSPPYILFSTFPVLPHHAESV